MVVAVVEGAGAVTVAAVVIEGNGGSEDIARKRVIPERAGRPQGSSFFAFPATR